MRKIYSSLSILLVCTTVLLTVISCGNAETKVNREDSTGTKNIPDTTEKKNNSNNTERPAEDRVPGNDGQSATVNNTNPNKDEILANIDQYLVSAANFPAPPANGGIVNATVTLKNTLPDITIQKAILEVSILTSDGSEFRTDYYVLQNVEPGEVETIKIPNAARGNSIVSHVVKLKSLELTNGEMVLVGHRVTAK